MSDPREPSVDDIEHHRGDPQFGPLVLVGAGGVLVEIMRDRRLAMPPLDEDRARSMVDRLEVPRCSTAFGANPWLTSMRSRGRSSPCRGSRTISPNTSEAIDANPVICGPDGASLSTPS
jgi:acetate---CoA ligase (ADP-forming)